jgi:tetratricopeptide (TPR) repeat protein
MPHKKNDLETENVDRHTLSPKQFKAMLKLIGSLNRTGMEKGNLGKFNQAFLLLEDALSLSRDISKKCLEAKVLNNMGILHTMSGSWDKAMINYDQALNIVSDHYGTNNFLYKTLQKNICHILNLALPSA